MSSGLKVNVKKLETKKIKDFSAKGARILVGFPSGRTHTPSGDDISELAKILSVGDATMPARPFLEEGILSKKEELKAEIKQQAKNLVETGRTNYHKIGTEAVKAVKDFVWSDFYKVNAPNAPATIAAKSKGKGKKKQVSDRPLIDTGELINATSYLIVSLDGSATEGKK